MWDYSRDVDGGETTPTVLWLATLTTQLPATSRIARAEHPENEWTTTDYLLRQLEYGVRLLMWGLGGGDSQKPDPIPSPADRAAHEEAVEQAEQMAQTIASIFNLERGD